MPRARLRPPTPAQARAKVRELAAAGVDAIKAVIDRLMVPDATLDAEVLVAIADESSRLGLPLLVHAASVDAMLRAVEQGADRRELFYWLDGRIMVAPVEMRPVFSHGRPNSVGGADNYLSGPAGARNFDIATDGRILALKPRGGAGLGNREIRVVLNWTEELKAKVPAP